MTRRRSLSRTPLELDLFPFLSILACTIGTLVLLIIVISIQTFNSQKEIKILAKTEEGVNQTKTPRYIECRGDGIIIYPSQSFVAIADIESRNSPLNQLLAEVRKNRASEYLIVAVRPDGIAVFQTIRSLIEEQEIDIGYEPIEENWQLKIE